MLSGYCQRSLPIDSTRTAVPTGANRSGATPKAFSRSALIPLLPTTHAATAVGLMRAPIDDKKDGQKDDDLTERGNPGPHTPPEVHQNPRCQEKACSNPDPFR